MGSGKPGVGCWGLGSPEPANRELCLQPTSDFIATVAQEGSLF